MGESDRSLRKKETQEPSSASSMSKGLLDKTMHVCTSVSVPELYLDSGRGEEAPVAPQHWVHRARERLRKKASRSLDTSVQTLTVPERSILGQMLDS